MTRYHHPNLEGQATAIECSMFIVIIKPQIAKDLCRETLKLNSHLFNAHLTEKIDVSDSQR